MGLKRERGAPLGLRGFRPVQIGSKAEPVRPDGIYMGCGLVFSFQTKFSLSSSPCSLFSLYLLSSSPMGEVVAGAIPATVGGWRRGGRPSWTAAPPLKPPFFLIFFSVSTSSPISSFNFRFKNSKMNTVRARSKERKKPLLPFSGSDSL